MRNKPSTMYMLNATDDYGVQTRLVVGCKDSAGQLAQALDYFGFEVVATKTRTIDVPYRDDDELDRAGMLARMVHVLLTGTQELDYNKLGR